MWPANLRVSPVLRGCYYHPISTYMRSLITVTGLCTALGLMPDPDLVLELSEFESHLEYVLESNTDFAAVWDLVDGKRYFKHSLSTRNESSRQSVLSPYLRLVSALEVSQSREAEFLAKTKLQTYCYSDFKSVRKILTLAHVQLYTSQVNGISEPSFYPTDPIVLRSLFAQIARFCPIVMANPLMKNLRLLHAIHDRGVESLQHVLYLHVMEFDDPFESAIELLNGYPAEYLRRGFQELVAPGGEILEPLGNVREVFVGLNELLRREEIVTASKEPNLITLGNLKTARFDILTFIGRFIALSIIHEQPFVISCNGLFYAYLLKGKLDLEDAAELPEFQGGAFERIMAAQSNSEIRKEQVYLHGSKLSLDIQNREKVIMSVLEQELTDEDQWRLDVVRKSFLEVIPEELLKDLNISPSDFSSILKGTQSMPEWDEVADSLRFVGYTRSSPEVKEFFDRLYSASVNTRMEAFVQLAGAGLLPLGGLARQGQPCTVFRVSASSKLTIDSVGKKLFIPCSSKRRPIASVCSAKTLPTETPIDTTD